MEKVRILKLLKLFTILTLATVILAIIPIVTVTAASATQQVTVTVVPGFLNIISPVNKIYQQNLIPTIISIKTGSLKVKNIFLIDNNDKTNICTNCVNYSQTRFYSDGKHNINIQAVFETGDIIQKNISFFVDSGSEIYILSGNSLKKATTKDIVNYLFNYNFTIIYENNTTTPEDSCSVVASKGNATLNSISFGNSNSINFYSVTSIEQGQGTLTAQKSNTRISINFIINQTLQNTENLLELQAVNTKTKEVYILDFNKSSKTVTVTSSSLSIINMKVSSSKGCSSKKTNFYFLQNTGKTSRTIQEVRQILLDNPIFLARHSNLNFLFTSSWQIQKFFGFY